MIDYLSKLPLKGEDLPPKLRELLSPVKSFAPLEKICVTSHFETNGNQIEGERENLHMLMATVPEGEVDSISVCRECNDGVVAYSEPWAQKKGEISNFSPSVSGYDYIVASWGDGSHYSFALAEKVWMSLGLSPRILGNSEQRMVYDNLSLPEMSVAEGDVSNEYYFSPSKEVKWTIQNSYLRKYLWLRGHYGVRVFFYEKKVETSPSLIELMNGESHVDIPIPNNWGKLSLRTFEEGILIQVWGTVVAIGPELCSEKSIDSFVWPDFNSPLSASAARSLRMNELLYVRDEFLKKYEDNSVFDSSIYRTRDGKIICSPGYKGQWGFRGFQRVGRNFLSVPIYELYSGIPIRELEYLSNFAISKTEISSEQFESESIVSKTFRFLDEILNLGDNLEKVSSALFQESIAANDFVGFARLEYEEKGINAFPVFRKLSKVASEKIGEHDFLSRCKTINEIINKIKVGPLRRILREAGCGRDEVSKFRILRLIQAFMNVVSNLNESAEKISAFRGSAECFDWNSRNIELAFLFVNNDLRVIDAHEKEGAKELLESLEYETAKLNSGYADALDFLFDGVISSLKVVNQAIEKMLQR